MVIRQWMGYSNMQSTYQDDGASWEIRLFRQAGYSYMNGSARLSVSKRAQIAQEKSTVLRNPL